MNKMLDDLHEQVPPDYYDQGITYNALQSFWHRRRFAEIKKLIHDFRAQKILDVGCHGGRFTYELFTYFPKASVYGIDISPTAIAYAQKRYKQISFQIARAEKLPFKDGEIDLVTSFDVLEHIEDIHKAVEETGRVLKPHGDFVISVPSESVLFRLVWYLWVRLGPGRVWHGTHVHKFKKRMIDEVLETHGFKVIERRLILGGMLLLVHARKER